MKRLIGCALFITVMFVIRQKSFAQTADILLTNGKIFTSDTSCLYVQALAINGNKILAVGTNAEIMKHAGNNTQKIDLKGKTVIPGLNNAHDHLAWRSLVGKYYTIKDFSEAGPPKKDVLDSIARLVKTAKTGQWISGHIGLTVFRDKSMRRALDSVAPYHPVYLQVMWGHGIVLNSNALQLTGISETALDPLGGWYDRYPETKVISGALNEYAQWAVWYAFTSSEPDKVINGLRAYTQEQIQSGITTVQDMECMIDPEAVPGIYSRADLPLRVRVIAMPGTNAEGRSLRAWSSVKPNLSPLTYHSGIKYLIEGTPIEQLSLQKKAYPGNPEWFGRFDMPLDTIRQILREALTTDNQLMMHIVGDSSLSVILSLMKPMASGEVWKSKRVRIEHNPVIASATDAELNDLKEMGIFVMHTPKYNLDCRIRSLMEKGISVGISPDITLNPFLDLMIITSQQKNPNENISREQAIIAYTKTNACAEFAEKLKGTLMPGMLADLAVLSQDIFTVPTPLLPATKSVMTIIDGKIVFQQVQFTAGK